jgi:RNA 2',3'-cyclic 3'-phosphodiesterase
MRLFVAVLPPQEALDELGAAVRPLRAVPESDRLSWVAPTGWHLTLAFLGEVDEALLPGLEERLARAARRHAPYVLRLAGGGRFGDRVLWMGVDGDTAALRRLGRTVQAAARRAGTAVAEEQRFHPHLTIARNRSAVPLRPLADRLAPFQGREWTAASIALVRSHPPAPGVPGAQPRYEALRAWTLGHRPGQ